jgi:hypothetical protein
MALPKKHFILIKNGSAATESWKGLYPAGFVLICVELDMMKETEVIEYS